jgi:hypothetical protein
MRLTLPAVCALVALASLSPCSAQTAMDPTQPMAPGYAPPGYPPQGAPPQGMPPQGMPPQGMGPQGMGPQGMGPQGMGPQGGMGPHANAPQQTAMRACMQPYRPAIRQQVVAHMQQWQAANPGAPGDAMVSERRAFVRVVAKPYRQQCRAQLGGPGMPGPGPGGYGPGAQPGRDDEF